MSEVAAVHAHTAILEQDGLWHCTSCSASWPRYFYAAGLLDERRKVDG
jgi:hypothetical protein